MYLVKERKTAMKFISWNVNGLRAVMKKGFPEIFKELDADVFCLQETKLQEGQLSMQIRDVCSLRRLPAAAARRRSFVPL